MWRQMMEMLCEMESSEGKENETTARRWFVEDMMMMMNGDSLFPFF